MKVIVYSTPACPYCILLKNFLKKHNVAFEEIDISKNKEKTEELAAKGFQRVPIIEIDGKLFNGIEQKKIKEALKI
jgi:glutaredoxin